MKTIITDNFMLYTETAKKLYHDHAEKLPIIDFHNHLNQKAILDDESLKNIGYAWLSGDHYKWRAMRANGVSEKLITGDASWQEKFFAYADTVQNCFGNPLYHWTHLELKRYFSVDEILTPESAERIWEICNEKLSSKNFSVRNVLARQNVEALCTTDDPIDSLEYHKQLSKSSYTTKVLPTFRPEKALGIEKDGFAEYIAKLGEICSCKIESVEDVIDALKKRLEHFIEHGCRVSDHSLEGSFYASSTESEVNKFLKNRLAGKTLSETECAKYRGYVLTAIGKEYARKNLVMQLHIGAIRNNSKRMFEMLGTDIGLDSQHDFCYAPQLSALLSSMDETDELPKTILYYLNPKDTEMLATMAGNFQANEKGIRGKVQLGSAWWFCDHKNGMEHQMNALMDVGLISTFVGMLTDSRSFLSFPRHEYFRRILCNIVGGMVEKGEYPNDMDYLGKMIENICYYNAKSFFNL